jgi:Tfp pilus assembly protein PilO
MTDVTRIVHEKRHFLWPLAIALVANIAVFALVVYPLSQKVAMGQQEADAANLALLNARRDHQNAQATVTGKSQADTELKKFYEEVLPPDLSAARRITYLPIVQAAEEANLRSERLSTDIARVRDSSLTKLTQTTVLVGQYADIRKFIYELETRPEFIAIENLQLAQRETDGSRGITVTLQLATYFRTGGDGN